MKKILIATILTSSIHTAIANEAVESLSATAAIEYAKLNGEHEYGLGGQQKIQSNTKSLSTQITTPIEGTNFLGVSAGLSYQHSNYSNQDDIDSITRFTASGVNKITDLNAKVFLRDSDIGGISAEYRVGHNDYKSNYVWTDSIFGNSAGTNSGGVSNTDLTLQGKYYFSSVTTALIYNKSNQSYFNANTYTASTKIYLDDNNIVKLSASRNNMSSHSEITTYSNYGYYDVGFESRPQFMNKALRLGADFYVLEKLNNSTNYFAVYSFDNTAMFNTKPSLGISYNVANGFADTLTFTLGFTLNNEISLKDRDRKYQF